MISKEKNAKIYSRPRINFLDIITSSNKKKNNNNKNNKRTFYIQKIIFIALTAILTANLILRAVNPIIDRLCINAAKNIATRISNEEATYVMNMYQYDDLVTITKDNNNNIVMIQTKTSAINAIASDIPIKILKKFKENDNSNIYIYFGSILGLKTLSGIGPKIKARIINTGNVETNLKSEFISQGINQTLHKIYLEVKLNVSILTPYKVVTSSIINQVLITESIIVGNVPNAYYNVRNPTDTNWLNIIK